MVKKIADTLPQCVGVKPNQTILNYLATLIEQAPAEPVPGLGRKSRRLGGRGRI